jgi:glycerol-3-phosphate cytidylyltransferase
MKPIDLRDATVGFTCSAFDLLHAGHVAMLRECKQHCNFLIVGLHVDPTVDRPSKNKPVQSVYERYMQLKGCEYVDAIIPYETEEDLINIMAIEPIDVRFVGVEYKDTYITGQDICEKRGINIIYNERFHMYSSTELRSRLT